MMTEEKLGVTFPGERRGNAVWSGGMDATHHPHGKNSGHSRGADSRYGFDATSGLLVFRSTGTEVCSCTIRELPSILRCMMSWVLFALLAFLVFGILLIDEVCRYRARRGRVK
jgi:hypothetical protein